MRAAEHQGEGADPHDLADERGGTRQEEQEVDRARDEEPRHDALLPLLRRAEQLVEERVDGALGHPVHRLAASAEEPGHEADPALGHRRAPLNTTRPVPVSITWTLIEMMLAVVVPDRTSPYSRNTPVITASALRRPRA